ncbi:O-antigen ligase family protein [Bacteroides finegoldii]|uniref:O-antigen ligase family protein n=1 Tax=Bacteroides finegoldii TaxID=338188 RepID=UPI00189CBCD0|nr:O-antigen ligase family protein [Bacteroides finegoldii]
MRRIVYFFTELPIFASVKSTKVCQVLAWIFSIVAVANVTGFITLPVGSIYIALCGVCLIYILTCGELKFNGLYVIMYIAFGISALLAYEPFFNSKVRYMLFLCVTLLCTPCISSPTAIAFRSLVCRNILMLLTFLTIGSFLGYFWGINFAQISQETLSVFSSSTNFGGLYAHSMLLGPLSALVALVFLNTYMLYRKKIFIALFFVAASAVVMSASRGATLALVVPIAYLLFFMKDRGDSRKNLMGLLVVASIIAVFVGDRFAVGLINKQQNNVEAGGTFNSRESKWDNRLQEFEENPIFGIGFCAVDLQHYEDYNDAGGVEPGSTHLAILSMTGLVGMMLYLIVLFVSYRSVRRHESVVANMRMCLFLTMITHAIFEGYALFAGGFLCFMYWLVIGQCEDYKVMKKQNLL